VISKLKYCFRNKKHFYNLITPADQSSQQTTRTRFGYFDLSLNDVQQDFGLTVCHDVIFTDIAARSPSQWLAETLEEGFEPSIVSEKARSAFIVAPVLLYIKALNKGKIGLYAGARLDVDPAHSLFGVCDFIFSQGPMRLAVQAPAVIVTEARDNDIEPTLGQCAAAMVGAQRLNQRNGNAIAALYGCVTSGEVWQFLKLNNNRLTIDKNKYMLVDLNTILGALDAMVNDIIQQDY